MATETELVNSALRKIGAQRILDIADEVPSAGIASDVLTQERDYLLRSHNWNFAITRRKLSRLSDAPPFEFEYAFTTPSDCMRIVSVHDNDGGHGSVRYKAESLAQTDGYVAAILCNSPDLWLRYVRQVTDVNLMGPGFRQVLILRLAKVFATASANSNSLYQLVDGELKEAMRHARSIDGVEDYPERLPDGSWAMSRGGDHGGNRQ